MYSNLKTTILGNYVKIVSIDIKSGGKNDENSISKQVTHNEEKLKNNLIRAKNAILDIGLANDFKYYFTLTISSNFDRYSLNDVYLLFRRTIRKMRNISGNKVDYLIVPEQHKDGAWHFHGFFKDSIEDFIFVNKHLHLDVNVLNSLGWVNIQPIKDKIRISSYITKYIAKNLGRSIRLSAHCYFASKGLQKGVDDLDVIYDNSYFNNSFFDFKSDYCYKKIITLEEYKKIKTFLKDLS